MIGLRVNAQAIKRWPVQMIVFLNQTATNFFYSGYFLIIL